MPSLTQLVFLLAGSASIAAGLPLALTPRQEACAPVHVLLARGSVTKPGEGHMEDLADRIIVDNPGTTSEEIDYPALLFPYADSSATGTRAVIDQLTAYTNRCPDSRVVLLGYSQGAHIILDALCGGGGVPGLGPENAGINSNIGDKVVASIQMGDPRNVVGQSYNRGTAQQSGLFPRLIPEQSCDYYADRLRSYCDANDLVCAGGLDPIGVHGSYPTKYGNDALAFVNERIRVSIERGAFWKWWEQVKCRIRGQCS